MPMPHNSRSVLIVADDPSFARDVRGRWQLERMVPGFTVINTELLSGEARGNFDVAIVGPVRGGRRSVILKSLDSGGAHPVVCMVETGSQVQAVRTEFPRLLVVQQHEGWIETLVLLAGECLKRVDLLTRVRKAEQAAAATARYAALGRHMLDSHHDFNNLLTSVLGNAELMLLDSSLLPDATREQAETIHDMALHMHEIMQRFSSIAVEMQVTEKQSQDETEKLSHLSHSGFSKAHTNS